MWVVIFCSAEALPSAYRSLMTDENSDIASFYPNEFKVDVDGKRFLWQGVCILPFINEVRLLSATKKAKEDLKIYEAERNSVKVDLLFVRACGEFGIKLLINLNETPSNGTDGFVNLNLHSLDPSEEENRILCVGFELPTSEHIPHVLANVNVPEKTVYECDIAETELWHEHQGIFQGRRNPSETNWRRRAPAMETDTSMGGSGWRGRGGFKGSSNNSKQGVYRPTVGYNQPNYRAPFHVTGSDYRGQFNVPGSNRDLPVVRMQAGDHSHRPMWPCSYGSPRSFIPGQRGFMPRASSSNHGFGRSAHEGSFWSSPSMVGGMEKLSLSTADSEDNWITVKSRRTGRGRGRGQL